MQYILIMIFTMFLVHSTCTSIVKCNNKIGLYTRGDIEYPNYSGSFSRPEQLIKGTWKVERFLKFLPHKNIPGELMAVQLINSTKSEEYPARMIVIGYDEFGTNEFSIISQNSEIYTIQNTFIDLSEKNGVVVLTLEDEGGDGYYSTVWRFRYQDNCFRLIGYDNIYVIDNYSTDGTYELLQKFVPGINLYREQDYKKKGDFMTNLINK